MLYHVSPKEFTIGAVLSPTARGGACLASSVEQALYWGWVLYGKDHTRGATLTECSIYLVKVLGEGMVEDCIGHYAFERPGVIKKAEEVQAHNDLDGEVFARCPVVVVEEVKINPKQWQKWGEDYECRAFEAMRAESP